MSEGDEVKGFQDNELLQQVLEQVRTNVEEAEKFAVDPEGYLQSKGVNTENLKFNQIPSGELNDADLELAAGGMAEFEEDLAKPTVCTSVGAGAGVTVCSSVGE